MDEFKIWSGVLQVYIYIECMSWTSGPERESEDSDSRVDEWILFGFSAFPTHTLHGVQVCPTQATLYIRVYVWYTRYTCTCGMPSMYLLI
jgi:hypothetical protein